MATMTRHPANEMSAASTQTEIVSDDILRQCLLVIKEFVNLDHRVTKNQKGQEIIVVYRTDVFGLFGPPMDPITLAIDPSGYCLLAVLFKPVQRISFTSAENGSLDINSLFTLLQLVSGSGFCFCPGIPEKFLVGKVFNKKVILHKLPFKRYQADNCPVYYPSALSKHKNLKSSNIAVCQRCFQVAQLTQSVPAQHFTHKNQMYLKQAMRKEGIVSFLGDNVDSNGSPQQPFSVLPPAQNNYIVPQLSNADSGAKGLLAPGLSIHNSVGSEHINSGLPPTESVPKYVVLMDKLKTGTTSLRLMLQEKYKKKSCNFPVVELQAVNDETKKNHVDKKPKSNVCKQCKKTFSTPASLLNHLQRHEGLSGSWKHQLKSKKYAPLQTTATSLLKMIARSSRPQAGFKSKKNLHVMSDHALKVVLKYLEDLIPSMNGTHKTKKNKLKLQCKPPLKMTLPQLPSSNDDSVRSSSSLAAVQTLLEAAALTENGIDTSGNNNFSRSDRKRKAIAAVLPVPQTSPDDSWAKKSRKSSRLASKRSKMKQNDMKEPVNESSSTQDKSSLRNLDLLSSVSLNLLVPASNPITTYAVSHLNSFSQNIIHSVPHSSAVTLSNHSPEKQSFDKLPPLPPLLYAGIGHDQSFNSIEVTSPSYLRSLVNDSSSSDCGAIDLSKPKQADLSCNIPSGSYNGPLINGLDAPLDRRDDPKELLKCFMMLSKSSATSQSHHPENIISDKRSDSDLQARMFASARNYKVDKKSSCVPQVQAVIASTSRIIQGGKSGKGHSSVLQGDEIQCGYKWSGSGGLVKERTQMVRELVPADIMANFLNRSVHQMPSPHIPAIGQLSPPQQPTLALPNACSPLQDLSSSSSALNLTTAKSSHNPSPKRTGPGRPKKSPGLSFPTSPPTTWSPAASGSILRSSLLPGSNTPNANHGNTNQQLMNLPSNCASFAANSTASPARYTNASPLLAAKLHQPVLSSHEDFISGGYHTIDAEAMHGNNTAVTKLEIKSEPMDNFMHPSQDRIIMALPVKMEKSVSSQRLVGDDDHSQNLVMDIR